MPNHKDLSGSRFGRLVAIRPCGVAARRIVWMCRCDCGTEVPVRAGNLRCGNTLSCGCLRRERAAAASSTHHASDTRLYNIWVNMHQRCGNKNHPAYARYGGRGIQVCERWSLFENFSRDMSGAYQGNLTLDRIDNSKGYSLENCRWASHQTQQNNRSNNKRVTRNGRTISASIAAREIGLKPSTLLARLRRGMDLDQAMTTPTQ